MRLKCLLQFDPFDLQTIIRFKFLTFFVWIGQGIGQSLGSNWALGFGKLAVRMASTCCYPYIVDPSGGLVGMSGPVAMRVMRVCR